MESRGFQTMRKMGKTYDAQAGVEDEQPHGKWAEQRGHHANYAGGHHNALHTLYISPGSIFYLPNRNML